MLVLTRRTGETIIIGGNIQVTIVEVSGDRVRVGITAPKSIRVDRHEVHERRVLEGLDPSDHKLAEVT
jgi:carbon storage regulator